MLILDTSIITWVTEVSEDTMDFLRPGNRVRIKTRTGLLLEGIILPRYELYDPDHITLKLDNGYNIGIKKDNIEKIEPVSITKKEVQPFIPSLSKGEHVKTKNKIIVLGTGGTIASKIDYETGGVKPTLTAKDLLEAVPELLDIAEIETEVVFNIFSEDMNPEHWEKIAEVVYDKIEKDPDRGIVIAHGTDTMAYTAAALSFAIRYPRTPIALVGSQRSSDRPSSDSAFNLISASIYATSDIAEVAVVMHGKTGDDYALAHRGVRVRKMHSSRRDAFQSIDSLPIARIDPYKKKMSVLRNDVVRKSMVKETVYKPKFSNKVALIKYYPGMPSWILDVYIDKGYKGIVIEGTGLGHVSNELLDSIERAVEEDVIVAMTTQCIFGTVNLNVYSKGRKLLSKGVVPAGDMLGETAYVKLSWLIANYSDTREIKELFQKNLVGELEERRTIDLYPGWKHE